MLSITCRYLFLIVIRHSQFSVACGVWRSSYSQNEFTIGGCLKSNLCKLCKHVRVVSLPIWPKNLLFFSLVRSYNFSASAWGRGCAAFHCVREGETPVFSYDSAVLLISVFTIYSFLKISQAFLTLRKTSKAMPSIMTGVMRGFFTISLTLSNRGTSVLMVILACMWLVKDVVAKITASHQTPISTLVLSGHREGPVGCKV